MKIITSFVKRHPFISCLICAEFTFFIACEFMFWAIGEPPLYRCDPDVAWCYGAIAGATVFLIVFDFLWLKHKAAATILVGFGVLPAHAQFVQIIPTNYTITTRSELNVSWFRQTWILESEQIITLSTGIVEVVHKTWWHPSYGVRFMGSKWAVTPLLENRYWYFYSGGQWHSPRGGEHIRYDPVKAGAWQPGTTPIQAANMEPLFFVPTLVGTIEEGDEYWHTQITAPVLECLGFNGRDARRLSFRCATGQSEFDYDFDFTAYQVRIVALGVGEANRRRGRPFIDHFNVNWERTLVDLPL